MGYTKKFREDFSFGCLAEDSCKSSIDSFFNIKTEKSKKYSVYDYRDRLSKVIVELKSRRCKRGTYTDTMIGYNKIKEFNKLLRQGYKVVLCFNFTDGLYYYDYTEENKDWIRKGGRVDRGRKEIKKYYFIPNKYLISIYNAEGEQDKSSTGNTEGV